MVKAYSQNLRYSLIKRINAKIKESDSKLDLLPEIKTYEQEQKELDEEINTKKVPNDYAIDVNNLFFGKYTSNLGGGIINLNFNLVSWFENMNMRISNYFVFRSVPSGDYCMINEEGKIYIPDKPIENNSISILPTSPIKFVDIASVKHILEESLKKLDPIEDEDEFEIDEKEKVKERFESRYNLLNLMLSSCGYRQLDARNPFDWMILYAISVDDLFDCDNTLDALLSEVFAGMRK